MKDEKTMVKLLLRYKKLASGLVDSGPILQGTITKRLITIEKIRKGRRPEDLRTHTTSGHLKAQGRRSPSTLPQSRPYSFREPSKTIGN